MEEFAVKNRSDRWNRSERGKIHLGSGDSEPNNHASSESEEDVSVSSSSGGIIEAVQEKLQALEEESNRLNRIYMECKLKYVSGDSESESPNDPTVKSPPIVRESFVPKEAKSCQTDVEDVFAKMEKLTVKEEKREFPPAEEIVGKKSEVGTMQPAVRPPTKRQLQHRDFFLKNRQLLQALEKENAVDLVTSPSILESSESEPTESSKKKSPVLPLSGRAEESPEVKRKSSTESVRKALIQMKNQSDAECLALLEEARIKSPLPSVRRPLRQQMLLSDSDEERKSPGKSAVPSPKSSSSGKISVGKTGSDGF